MSALVCILPQREIESLTHKKIVNASLGPRGLSRYPISVDIDINKYIAMDIMDRRTIWRDRARKLLRRTIWEQDMTQKLSCVHSCDSPDISDSQISQTRDLGWKLWQKDQTCTFQLWKGPWKFSLWMQWLWLVLPRASTTFWSVSTRSLRVVGVMGGCFRDLTIIPWSGIGHGFQVFTCIIVYYMKLLYGGTHDPPMSIYNEPFAGCDSLCPDQSMTVFNILCVLMFNNDRTSELGLLPIQTVPLLTALVILSFIAACHLS